MTYYGGSNVDVGIAIAVDPSGNAFVTGQTTSSDFPVAGTPFQSALAGTQNSFLLELNPTGTKAEYASYLGGNGIEFGLGVALDSNDNAYLTGQTSSTNFPTAGTTETTLSGPTDAYVSVLSPTSSSQLLFSTYLGGGGDEDQLGGSIFVNTGGAIYVTGDTDSGNGTTTPFPTTPGPLDGTWGGGTTCLDSNGNDVPCPDAFVTTYTAVQ